MDFKQYIADIPNFPIDGILFRDITPLMADGNAFYEASEKIVEFAKRVGAEVRHVCRCDCPCPNRAALFSVAPWLMP